MDCRNGMYPSLCAFKRICECACVCGANPSSGAKGASVTHISSVDRAHCCCHGAGCQYRFSGPCHYYCCGCCCCCCCCRSPFTLISFILCRHHKMCRPVRGRIIRKPFQQRRRRAHLTIYCCRSANTSNMSCNSFTLSLRFKHNTGSRSPPPFGPMSESMQFDNNLTNCRRI